MNSKFTCDFIKGRIVKKSFSKVIAENFWYKKETPAVFQTFHPFMIGFGRLYLHFKYFYETNIVAASNGYGWYYATEADGLAVGKMLYDMFLKNEERIRQKKEEWKRDLAKLHQAAEKIHRVNLSKLSTRQLAEIYKNFLGAFYIAWTIPLIYEMNMVYVGQVLAPQLQRRLKLSQGEFNEVLSVLSAPLEFSYVTCERLELLKLALKFSEAGLNRHFSKYYWMKSTYRRMGLYSKSEIKKLIRGERKKGQRHIEKEIKSLEELPSELSKKQKTLIEKYRISADDLKLFRAMGFYGDWQDKRKEMNIYGNHHLFVLLHEISKRLKVEIDLLACAFPTETQLALLGKAKLAKSELKRRWAFNLHVVDGHLKELFLVGSEAKRLKEILDRKIEERFREVKGMVASIGQTPRTRGEVRVIFDPHGQDMPKGAILVTPMTRPEFTHLIHKAAAIVTDEGGVTSHAAIVSREFGIPCVVGTGTATKLLKNSDIVQVDTETGTVVKLAD